MHLGCHNVQLSPGQASYCTVQAKNSSQTVSESVRIVLHAEMMRYMDSMNEIAGRRVSKKVGDGVGTGLGGGLFQ